MGPYTGMVIFFNTISVSVNIVPHTSMVNVSFSEGGFTLCPAPVLFVRVWHPGFVNPSPAPAFPVIKFLHHIDILFSLVNFHIDIRY